MEQINLLSDLFDTIVQRFLDSDILFQAQIPVSSHAIKKNNRPIQLNRKTGARFVGKSDDLRAAEGHLTLALKSRVNEIGLKEPIRGPIWCIFSFYYKPDEFYTKLNEPSQLRGDLSNLYQLPEDCLEKAGVIMNDSQICSHDLSRRLVGESTYLEIFILRHKFDFRKDNGT